MIESLLKHQLLSVNETDQLRVKMVNDLTLLVLFFVFWLVVCVLFLVIYSLEQEHELDRNKALKD